MKLPQLKIGDLIAKIPIIQGGMGVGISLSGLASAVSNQGGIGVIAAAMVGMEKKNLNENSNSNILKDEIIKFRQKSKGILGVNIMVALTDYTQMVKTAINNRVDIIFSGAGLPLDLPKYLVKGAKTKLVPIVSSAKAAKVLCMRWLSRFNYLPDALVVEGPKAGGHLGFKKDQLFNIDNKLENIVPEVIKITKSYKDQKDIPVIPAGGIYNHDDIVKYLSMGASGVQMGTRFVATNECDASDSFKKAYINANKSDITIIKSPVGMPGRAIVNNFLSEVKAGIQKVIKCPYHCIKTCNVAKAPYCIAKALINAQKGLLESGFAFAGENVYKIKKIISVKELMNELKGK